MQTGPQAGLQTTLTQAQITFGRDPGSNVLVVQAPDVKHLSRQHGRLDLVNNQWVLSNLSNNGTTVNGRKIKGDQQVLSPGDVVGVAKKPLFSVQFNPMEPTLPPEELEAGDETVHGESALTQAKRKGVLRTQDLCTNGHRRSVGGGDGRDPGGDERRASKRRK